MVLMPTVLSIVYGIADAIGNMPIPDMNPAGMPEWYLGFNVALFIVVLIGTTGAGWYLSKKK